MRTLKVWDFKLQRINNIKFHPVFEGFFPVGTIQTYLGLPDQLFHYTLITNMYKVLLRLHIWGNMSLSPQIWTVDNMRGARTHRHIYTMFSIFGIPSGGRINFNASRFNWINKSVNGPVIHSISSLVTYGLIGSDHKLISPNKYN